MAEDVLDIAIENYSLTAKPCQTKELMLNGHDAATTPAEISSLTTDELKALIKKSVAEEMCMTVEDFLSRRTRQLLLDAQVAIEKAPEVATIMAKEMNKDENWIQEQINIFNEIANNYKPAGRQAGHKL